MTIPPEKDIAFTPRMHNRGNDTKFDVNHKPISVGLYTIDNAILYFLNTKIVPTVEQDNKQIVVPVMYGNPERWKSVQTDGGIRDENGKIMLPIIMLRRTSIKASSINSATNKYNRYTYQSRWNSRNIYDRFSVQNGITPSEAYQSVIIPDYYDVTYEVMAWTEYMAQMNKIIEDISVESNEYWGEFPGYRFFTKVDEFEQITDLPADNDRIVRTKFTLQVRAYILPTSALNDAGMRESTTKMQYGVKKIVFNKEMIERL